MTEISAQQLPSLSAHLLGSGRVAEALRLNHAFLERGHAQSDVLEKVLTAAVRAGLNDAVRDVLASLHRRFADYPLTWYLEFIVSRDSYRWQQALEAEARYRDLGGPPALTMAARAQLLERLFRPEEALQVLDGLEQASELEASRAAYVRVCALQQLGRRDEAVAQLQGFLQQAPENNFVVSAWKTLGKLLDQDGDREGAWKAWQTGNELAQRLVPAPLDVEHNALRRRVAVSSSVFTRDWAASWQPLPPAPWNPVFLVGFPRSGTTLLEQVLDAHPDVQALEERPLVEAAWTELGRQASRMVPEVSGLSRRDMEIRVVKQLAELSPSAVQGLREAYYQALDAQTERDPGKVFVDKLPLNLASMGFIHRLFPDAKFILALRHPADCVLSNYMQDFELNPGMLNMTRLETAATLYRDIMALQAQLEEVLGLTRQIHRIHYEDLVVDFRPQVESLLGFLGLSWDDAVLRYHDHAQARSGLRTPSYHGVTQGLYRGAMGRWRGYANRMAPVLPLLEAAADRFGYELGPEGGADL